MSNRFIHAVLNLLPGNLSQSPDNPLQIDRLPDVGGVELDYPVYQDSPTSARQQFLTLAFLASLAAPALAWTGHLIPLPLLHGGVHTIVLLVGGALVVRGLTGRRWPMASFGMAVAIVPILAFLVQELPFALAASVVGLAALGFLGDRLATAQLYFKTAAPLPHAQARPIRAAWRRRWTEILEPLRGAELYLAGYLVLIPACWLILRAVAATRGFGDFWTAVILFVQLTALGIAWYLLLEFFVAPFFGRPRYSLRSAAGAVFRALALWCSYNRRQAIGAGVHASPGGSCALRRLALVGVIVTWGCLWSGVQLHVPPDFPALLQEGITAWQEALPLLENLMESQQQGSAEEQPQDGELFQLTTEEQDYLKRVSPEKAEGYLTQRRELALAQRDEAAAALEAEQSRQTAENLIVLFFKKTTRILLRVLTPSLGVLAACWALLTAMNGRALAAVEERSPKELAARIYSSENWEGLVARIRASGDGIENQSVLWGANARDDTPIVVPRDVFADHTHILGDTGSGKTSRGITPLITQLMRLGDASVIILDLKADEQDPSLFETIRVEAERLDAGLKKKTPGHVGYPFRWFTTVVGRSSFAFNPLTQRAMPKLDPDQRSDILIAALGLNYGSDYGRKYFGDSNFDVLNYAIRENPDVENLAALSQILEGSQSFTLPPKTKESAGNLQSSIRRLSRFKSLNACPSQRTPQAVLDNAIDLDDLFTTPQALYVALPPTAGISNTAEIARIFLYSLMAAANVHGQERKQVYLVVDEFQRIVSKNVELFLQTARSMNIGCILANQSLADLNAIGADLIPAVRTNCRMRQVFGAGNYDDILDILGTSGEAIYAMRSWKLLPSIWSTVVSSLSFTETRYPRISVNDILLATDAPGRNIAYVRRGAGYAQFGGMPFLMDTVHHIDREEYKRRKRAAWPPADERMLVSTLADWKVPPLPAARILGEIDPGQKASAAPSATATGEDAAEDSSEQLWDAFQDEYDQEKAAHEAKLRRRRRPGQP